MKAITNLAISSGFIATVAQIMFWILRSQSSLEPRISWPGAYGVSVCALTIIASLKVLLSSK